MLSKRSRYGRTHVVERSEAEEKPEQAHLRGEPVKKKLNEGEIKRRKLNAKKNRAKKRQHMVAFGFTCKNITVRTHNGQKPILDHELTTFSIAEEIYFKDQVVQASGVKILSNTPYNDIFTDWRSMMTDAVELNALPNQNMPAVIVAPKRKAKAEAQFTNVFSTI